MLEQVKIALDITEEYYDAELTNSIQSAVNDLNVAGVDSEAVTVDTDNALVKTAIITYCSYMFQLMHGSETRALALKTAYDEQKAQMSMSTGYTTGGGFDE